MSATKDVNPDARALFQAVRLVVDNDGREQDIRVRRRHMASFLRRGERWVLVRGMFGYQLEVRGS